MYEYRTMSEEKSDERQPTEKQAMYVGDSPIPVGGHIAYNQQGGLAPEGAVYLSNSDVLKMEYKLIDDWKPRREVWPLTYGVGVAGGLAVVSGAIFTTYLRHKMKLFNHNRFSTLVSSCIIPALTASALEIKAVMEPILLRDYDCPLCIQMRAAAYQMAVVGIQMPVVSFAACASVATMGFRYTFPPISDFGAWSKSVYGLVRPFGYRLLFLTLFNGYCATLLAYKQQQAAALVQDKLMGVNQSEDSQQEELEDQ